jgi:8-oxo-dGTP pyrophosphatase MutT (NUDIX family)
MRSRPTVRLLVVDEQQRILLFKYEDAVALDPTQPHMTIYWVTPGGGVEPSETFEQAGLRELWEETGIQLTGLGPCVWRRSRTLLFPDESLRLDEHFYLAPVSTTQVVLTNLLPYERQVYRAHRWWTIEEIQRSEEVFLLPGFPYLLQELLAGTIPAEPLQLLD